MSLWRMLGLAGTVLFASRWLVQLHCARRARSSVVTPLFWLLTIGGSTLLLAYFTVGPHRDPVGALGNALPFLVAAYNLTLARGSRGGDGSDRRP